MMIHIANPIYDSVFMAAAASDTKLRHDMNVEDEFFSAIENRDTAIMARDKKIEEQDQLISEKNIKISEQNDMISEQSNKISEQSNKISEQSNKISEQSNKISEQSNIITEQNYLLKKMVKGMLSRGLAMEDIAIATGTSVDSITQMLNS